MKYSFLVLESESSEESATLQIGLDIVSRLTRVKMSKRTQEVIDEANRLWPVSRYDKEGRSHHDKLITAKLNTSDSKFKKWSALDQYLVLTHFPEMRKQFGRQEKDRASEEDEQNAVDLAREARLAKRTSTATEKRAQSASENHSDEIFQRQEVINVNLICCSKFMNYYDDE